MRVASNAPSCFHPGSDRGDNLFKRIHIQNFISLTIAMLPRIIWADVNDTRSEGSPGPDHTH
jgi:hypothetical protein